MAQATAPTSLWPQWGGPNRDFVASPAPLATSWPAGGPRRLWERALGEGHSSIVTDGRRLYTMYRPYGLMSMLRRSQEEVVVALDPASGETIWEYRYAAPTSGINFDQGAGPHSTPLVAGERVFAASSFRQLFAVDRQSGRLLWSHDLIEEYGGPGPDRGYAPSPIAYGTTVIVPAGGDGQSLMAFDQETGELVWKAGDYAVAPASPVFIDVDGQQQLVVFGGDEVVGVDPSNGTPLWRHPHKTEWGLNISTPVWGPGNRLLISSAYNSGTRLLQLTRSGEATEVSELWFQNRMRVHIGTVIRIGDHAYGSSGDFGPCPLVGIDLKTGTIVWQDRSFARATLVQAGDTLIVLDEDGTLGLVTVSPGGMKVLARASILENLAWTPPTLIGTRLYARDRRSIVALELGR